MRCSLPVGTIVAQLYRALPGRGPAPGPGSIAPVTAPIMQGAEPWSAAGGPDGVLVLHGFTGNPQSMRPLAEALAARRVHGGAAPPARARDVPRGPGPDPVGGLVGRGRGPVPGAGRPLRPRGRGRPVDGWRPDLLAGRAPPPPLGHRRGQPAGPRARRGVPGGHPGPARRRDRGRSTASARTSRRRAPSRPPTRARPLAAVLSLFEGADEVEAELADIHCPVLVLSSREDHVVESVSGDVSSSGSRARSSGSGWRTATTWPPSTTTPR